MGKCRTGWVAASKRRDKISPRGATHNTPCCRATCVRALWRVALQFKSQHAQPLIII